jgi:hypothetical protein
VDLDPGWVSSSGRRLAVESWLRRRGLPLAVRHDRSALQRSVPGVLGAAVAVPWLNGIEATIGQNSTPGLVLVLLTPVLFWLVARWTGRGLARLGARGRWVVTAVVFAVLVLIGLVEWLLPGGEWQDPVAIVVLLLLAVGIVWSGLVSIAGWTLSLAMRRVAGFGDLVSRTLPLLMLFTLFGFYGAEIWQAMDGLAPQGEGRGRLWLAIGFLGLLTSLFLIAVLRDESRGMVDRLSEVDVREHTAQLVGTPVAGLVSGTVPRRPLSRRERVNIHLLLYLGHALQTLAVATVVFAFFLLFGSITVRPSVIADWVHHEPTVPGLLFGYALPVPDELVKVSLFLAAFTGMYFAAQMALDSTYRTRFFEPLFAEVAATLVGRDIYLAVWHASPAAPGDEPGDGVRSP